MTVTTAGTHTLEFWSVDVAGNAETPAQDGELHDHRLDRPDHHLGRPADLRRLRHDHAHRHRQRRRLGRRATHYILDGGAETTGTVVTASAAGSHTLEFWSVDVAGNAETPHTTVSFTISDSIAPTTTSDAAGDLRRHGHRSP